MNTIYLAGKGRMETGTLWGRSFITLSGKATFTEQHEYVFRHSIAYWG